MTTRPLVVTAGEPAGIGPDLCIAAAGRRDLPPFVVIGDATLLSGRAATLGADVTIAVVDDAARPDALAADATLYVIDMPFPHPVDCGRPDPRNAQTLLDGLAAAVEGCLAGRYAGLVTAPLAKHVIADAGIPFSGHTEYLAELTDTATPVMLLVAGTLRVALATTHLPLREVADAITRERLVRVIDTLNADLEQRFGIASPRILVCGLNPHAGEGGHLGREEIDVIAPVIESMAGRGLNVHGPLPADTAFTPAAGVHDAILAMYHDQGLPPLKQAGFGRAVNVTLGLPVVRTSVDHGTAFDIAGSGHADAGSLVEAIRLAGSLADGTSDSRAGSA